MKRFQVLICFFLLIAPTLLFSQNEPNNEEKTLKFQEFFFEALKQKAIRNYDKAIESLQKGYEIDSLNTALLFEFSKNYLFQKKYSEAEYFINKAIYNEPKNHYLQTHKATIFKEQKLYAKASEVLEKIVDKHPRYSDELVWLYIKERQFEKAKKAIENAEKKALISVRLRRYKMIVNQQQKSIAKKTKSKKSPQKLVEDIAVLRSNFNTKKDYKTLQALLKQEEKQQKHQWLYEDSKEGLSLFPMQSFLYAMNGKALNKLNKFKEALKVLKEGVGYVVDNAKLEALFYEQIAISYKGLGKPQKAEKYIKKRKRIQ